MTNSRIPGLPISSMVEEALTGRQAAKRKSQRMIKVFSASIVITLMQFWFAQLVVWGLSLFHVNSGIWGPWLIMEGIGSLIAGVVWIGSMHAMTSLDL